MVAPTYETDLQDISDAEDIAVGPWSELTGHTSGGAASDEADYFIQASQCVSQSTGGKTGTVCGLQFDYGSDMSASFGPTDHFFFWTKFLAPNNS